MKGFPYVPMEVVERSQYDGGTYFLIQTKEDRNGWEVAEVRPDIPWQPKVAQLLAAAPDLLEALTQCRAELLAMIDMHNQQDEDDGSWLYDYQTVVEADAAIAKAKGDV